MVEWRDFRLALSPLELQTKSMEGILKTRSFRSPTFGRFEISRICKRYSKVNWAYLQLISPTSSQGGLCFNSFLSFVDGKCEFIYFCEWVCWFSYRISNFEAFADRRPRQATTLQLFVGRRTSNGLGRWLRYCRRSEGCRFSSCGTCRRSKRSHFQGMSNIISRF